MIITNIKNCARCGGDHSEVIGAKLTIPFSPPEAAPVTWTHWAMCPSNGEPILIKIGDGAVDGDPVYRHGRR